MLNRLNPCLSTTALAALSLASLLAACQPAPLDDGAAERAQDQAPPASALALGVPILALMLGPIGDASDEIFRAAISPEALSDEGWMRIGAAAVDLVGDASAITLPGPGPKDKAWVIDPAWRERAGDMRAAGLALGAAASRRDGAALTEAAAQLAASCQACHLIFSPHLVTAPPDSAGR